MGMWAWVVLGGGAFVALTALASLALAAVLGRIAREVSLLVETDHWSSAPLARHAEDDRCVPVADGSRSLRVDRTGQAISAREGR